MTRAAIYVRVSTEDQAEDDRCSLPTQREDCLAHCKRKGYDPLPIYGDIQSGCDAYKDREAWTRLLQDIRAGLVDVLVVWEGERLNRSARAAVDLWEALTVHETEVEAVKEGSLTRDSVIDAGVGGQKWLKKHRERIRMGMRGRAKRGKYAGGIAPYGYAIRRCDCPREQQVPESGARHTGH